MGGGDMTSSSNRWLVTSTDACRVLFFQPTRRPRWITVAASGPWGAATVTGRLGQQHRDVLDLAMDLREGWRRTSEGDVVIIIDSARLRAELGWNSWAYHQILDTLRDLRTAEISTALAGWPPDCTGIVTRIAESLNTPPPRRAGSRARGVREWEPPMDPSLPRGGMMWEITISQGWLGLIRRLQTRYPRVVTNMRYGVSQAVTRLMLSHRPGTHYRIDTVLDVLRIEHRRRRRAIRHLVADRDCMAAAGVLLDTGDGGVWTTEPWRRRAHPRSRTTEPRAGPQNPGADRRTPEPIEDR